MYEISSREPLNGFATNSHGRRDGWSRARTTLKVKVNFGYLRAVCLKNIFAPVFNFFAGIGCAPSRDLIPIIILFIYYCCL